MGYHHGKTVFKGWVRGNKLPDIFREHPSRSHMTHAYATGQPVGKVRNQTGKNYLARQGVILLIRNRSKNVKKQIFPTLIKSSNVSNASF